MNLMKAAKLWLPVVLWAAVIFTFSSFSTIETSEIYWQDFVVKKLAHLTEYAIFAGLLYRAFINSGMEKKRAGWYAILAALAYGVSDEFHQGFTPGREPTARDVIIDTIGGSIGIYVLTGVLPKAPEKFRLWAKKFSL